MSGAEEVTPRVPFHSILFDEPATQVFERDAPAFFADLNLDQVIESLTAGREEYDLTSFFYTRLHTVEAITYRHEVLRDLEDNTLLKWIDAFAQKMRSMRHDLSRAAKLHYRYQRESWFMGAAQIYCDAVVGLTRDLASADLRSRGLLGLREYLAGYARSGAISQLAEETRELRDRLSEVTYCLDIYGSRVKVSRYHGESDYGADVLATFEKFKHEAAKDYRVRFSEYAEMNQVEAGVLERVAKLYPDIFSALDRFCDRHRDYLDETVGAFDREVQFYVAYLEFAQRLRQAGLAFCYPQVSDRSKEVIGRDAFDVALANKLVSEKAPVVCNDFHLKDPERIFVVSGPNQGGKTTFARMFGQMHYLGSIGCLVPGTEAELFVFDQVFTHFESEETLQDLSGKLQDDLLRLREILDWATPSSVVIMNEVFTSTTLSDAVFLGTNVLQEIVERDLLCVCVTFVDELASLSETTVSMVSMVDPENPAVRTFRIARRHADGLAYAAAIAEKYRLTYENLKVRIAS